MKALNLDPTDLWNELLWTFSAGVILQNKSAFQPYKLKTDDLKHPICAATVSTKQ
jgi:hypothetical protein